MTPMTNHMADKNQDMTFIMKELLFQTILRMKGETKTETKTEMKTEKKVESVSTNAMGGQLPTAG